jgi:K(+)-stimulated pyrophosphate-energized sodium pump
MIVPGLLVVGTPVAVGLIFRFARNEDVIVGGQVLEDSSGWLAVAGLLMVGTIGGIVLATFFNNVGGAWDNAKKYIEAGNLRVASENGTLVTLGKGSDAHKAAVVGDTVGDPFKDTAGPSLHVLVKLLSTVTLVLAPLFIS